MSFDHWGKKHGKSTAKVEQNKEFNRKTEEKFGETKKT